MATYAQAPLLIRLDRQVDAGAGGAGVKGALAGERPWPSPRQAWWSVSVFGFTLAMGQVDRGIVNILVEPLKAGLGLSDTQISLVMGFAFVSFYLLLGLPAARLADGGTRRLILGVAAAVWGFSTMMCGFASGFAQLALARVGVGAGESAVSPAIGSMMSDLFPPQRLARAMSIMALAAIAGNGLALLFGGLLIDAFTKLGRIDLPVLGTFEPWQATFAVVGLPGLLASLLYFLVPEPARRIPASESADRAPSLRTVFAYLRQNGSLYLPMFAGLALNSTVAFGMQAWTPAFFTRTFGWSPGQFGTLVGPANLIVMPFGILIGIRAAELFHARGYDDANLRLTAVCAWLAAPLFILMPLMPTPGLSVVLLVAAGTIGMAAVGAQNAALLIITPNRMRGQVTALYLIMYNVIGYGLGPTLVALVTDYGFGSESQLKYAMACIALLSPIGAIFLTLGLRPMARAVAAMRQ